MIVLKPLHAVRALRAGKNLLVAGLVALAIMPWQVSVADHRDIVELGTYSSLVLNDESEDLNGYEIEVLPSPKGIRLVLQIAEGELTDVVVADATAADGRLTATFDLPSRKGCRLDALVQDSSLVVTFVFGDGASDTATLERSAGFWDRNVPK